MLKKPGENYHQVKDWGAGRELPASWGALLGKTEGRWHDEVSPASFL